MTLYQKLIQLGHSPLTANQIVLDFQRNDAFAKAWLAAMGIDS
jgi:hypothetical protein